MTLRITTDQALAFRLARQCLTDHQDDPLAALSAILGAQAQVHSAAVLQVRARVPRATSEDIASALLDSRTVVKLWAQRSTLHLFARPDVPMVVALRRRMLGQYRRWMGRNGVEPAAMDRLAHAIGQALADGPMTRAELAQQLCADLGEWARPWLEHSWGGAIKYAAAMGFVCHGPERPRETLFARLDKWIGHAVDTPDDDGPLIAELAGRYLSVYGPATPRDFVKFTGLTAGEARDAFARLNGDLISVDVDGQPAHTLAKDEQALREASMTDRIVALPLFDPYLLGHADTGTIVPPRAYKKVYRTAGWISPVVLRRGRAVATWSHRQAADGWQVEIQPFGRFGERARAKAERSIARLAGATGARQVTAKIAADGA